MLRRSRDLHPGGHHQPRSGSVHGTDTGKKGVALSFNFFRNSRVNGFGRLGIGGGGGGEGEGEDRKKKGRKREKKRRNSYVDQQSNVLENRFGSTDKAILPSGVPVVSLSRFTGSLTQALLSLGGNMQQLSQQVGQGHGVLDGSISRSLLADG